MNARASDGRGRLMGFVLYALAAHGVPTLTQEALSEAVVAAFGSSGGRILADAAGVPSPELLGSQAEVVGAFGDWVRAQGLVEGCGFTRSEGGVTCAFRACACSDVVDRLRAERPDAAPPCILIGLLTALLQARGIHAKVGSFRKTDEGCEWKLDLGR